MQAQCWAESPSHLSTVAGGGEPGQVEDGSSVQHRRELQAPSGGATLDQPLALFGGCPKVCRVGGVWRGLWGIPESGGRAAPGALNGLGGAWDRGNLRSL